MLHLVLIDHDMTGGCFELASKFLRPYFPTGGLYFCKLEFDIGDASKIQTYQRRASALIQELRSNWTRIVIAITNHTDNDRGDLFVGYEGQTKVYVSAHVHSVSHHSLLTPCLLTGLHRFLTSSFRLGTR
jgi:hypothetical protein